MLGGATRDQLQPRAIWRECSVLSTSPPRSFLKSSLVALTTCTADLLGQPFFVDAMRGATASTPQHALVGSRWQGVSLVSPCVRACAARPPRLTTTPFLNFKAGGLDLPARFAAPSQRRASLACIVVPRSSALGGRHGVSRSGMAWASVDHLRPASGCRGTRRATGLAQACDASQRLIRSSIVAY